MKPKLLCTTKKKYIVKKITHLVGCCAEQVNPVSTEVAKRGVSRYLDYNSQKPCSWLFEPRRSGLIVKTSAAAPKPRNHCMRRVRSTLEVPTPPQRAQAIPAQALVSRPQFLTCKAESTTTWPQTPPPPVATTSKAFWRPRIAAKGGIRSGPSSQPNPQLPLLTPGEEGRSGPCQGRGAASFPGLLAESLAGKKEASQLQARLGGVSLTLLWHRPLLRLLPPPPPPPTTGKADTSEPLRSRRRRHLLPPPPGEGRRGVPYWWWW